MHGMYTVFKKCLGKLECFNPRDSMSRFSYVIHRWFARDVIAAILVDESKRFLISSLRSSTTSSPRDENHLFGSFQNEI